MKFTAALFAFFVFPTFVTSIPLDTVNDNEQNIDKRQLSNEMTDIVNAVNAYADEYNYYRGYSRSDFTANIVQALWNRDPHFNYIICHTDHGYNFGTLFGVDVYNVWVSYKHHAVLGKDPGYDVVIGKNGTFDRYGDGGSINWAYIGRGVLVAVLWYLPAVATSPHDNVSNYNVKS